MNIYVGNLSYKISEEELKEVFEQYGSVDSVKIVRDRDTGRSKGYAFLEMPEDSEAQQAIDGLNEKTLGERTLVVNQARPREERQRPPQRNFGSRRY
ncbi:MAG TPA: RNA-binding protein [Anseongella sp.]|nr:RNA-binding protein [Anseongella sp.]